MNRTVINLLTYGLAMYSNILEVVDIDIIKSRLSPNDKIFIISVLYKSNKDGSFSCDKYISISNNEEDANDDICCEIDGYKKRYHSVHIKQIV